MKTIMRLLLLLTISFGCGKKESDRNVNAAQIYTTADLQPGLVVAAGKVEPENEIITLSAPAGGIVKAIFRNDGDNVVKGEILVQLDDDLEQSKMIEISTQAQTQRAQIEVEQTQLKEVQIDLEDKTALLNKIRRLLESGAETQQVYDDLSTKIKVLEVNVERSKAGIQYAKSKLNEFTAQLKTAETEIQKKQFKAPLNGVILDMQVVKGQATNEFSTYAEMAPSGSLMVKAEVDELFSSKVQNGQQVTINYTCDSKVITTGQITMVAPYLKKKSIFSEKANDQQDRRVREIRIALKDASSLIINAKVECKIQL